MIDEGVPMTVTGRPRREAHPDRDRGAGVGGQRRCLAVVPVGVGSRHPNSRRLIINDTAGNVMPSADGGGSPCEQA